MSDRIRQPDAAALLGRPGAEPVDAVAELAARSDLESFALAATQGVLAPGAPTRPAIDTTAGAGNLIVDGSFEGTALSPLWTVASGTLALSTAQAYDGLQSMLYTGIQNSILYGFFDTGAGIVAAVPCKPGDGVYFEAQVMQGDTNSAKFNLGITYVDAAGNQFADSSGGSYFNSAGIDSRVAADGWQKLSIFTKAPANSIGFYVYLQYTPSVSSSCYIDAAFCCFGNTFIGPMATAPLGSTPRIEIVGTQETHYSGHHLESSPGHIQAGVLARGLGAAKDQGFLSILTSALGAAAAAEIQLTSASQDGTQLAQILMLAEIFASNGLDLAGGLSPKSFVLDIYQPADINPVLTAAGNTANCGAQHTAFTIIDGRKMAILCLHFCGVAAVSNAATSIQHVQSGLLTNTAGGAPATASTFSIPTAVVGTSIDRQMAVSGFLSTGVVCSGAFNVLPQIQWSTTVVVGAGGVSNLRTFSSTVITIAIPVM